MNAQSIEALLQVVVVGASVVVGVVLLSFFAAVLLRLAAFWLKMPTIPYRDALRGALIANLVLTLFNSAVGYYAAFSASSPYTVQSFFSPLSILAWMSFDLVLTAAILGCTIRLSANSQQVSFRDSLALAAVYGAHMLLLFMMLGLAYLLTTAMFAPNWSSIPVY